MTGRTGSARYTIISADAHAGAPVPGYREYLPARWHEEFDDWARTAASRWEELNQGRENTRNWDSNRRLRDCDADGIAAELIFPNTIPPFYPRHALGATLPDTREEYERRLAGVRASNRWVADFCAAAPLRRRGVVQILLNDIDDAVEDIRWGKEAGLAAILIPGIKPGHPLDGLWSDRYDPIWAAAQELELPVNQHSGAGAPEVGTDPGEVAAHNFESVATHFYSQRAIWNLIYGGVLERFPGLKFVMTEDGLGWVPELLELLDNHFRRLSDPRAVFLRMFGSATRRLTMMPSEYVRSHFYFCASGDVRKRHVDRRAEIGIGHIMWGSDYPHDEGTFPFSREALRSLFWDVPEGELRQVLAHNPAEIYGFDLPALDAVAARIGPTVAEIATRIEQYPRDSILELFIGAPQA